MRNKSSLSSFSKIYFFLNPIDKVYIWNSRVDSWKIWTGTLKTLNGNLTEFSKFMKFYDIFYHTKQHREKCNRNLHPKIEREEPKALQ